MQEIGYALNRLRISTDGTGQILGKNQAKQEIIEWHKQEVTDMLNRLYKANDYLDPSKIITAIDKERAELRKMK